MSLKDKILILIFVLAIFLRLYDLGKVPPGLYLDETQYGLDAYSILKTGRDVYGHFLPLAFQSSGYYPPLFTYILAPFLIVFPLSPFSVRLPAALAGVFTILFFFLFTQKLILDKKSVVPYVAAIIMSISWWHIHISRVAFLASFGLFFLVSGCYFFLRGLEKYKYLFVSIALFGLATFAHYGYKLIAPVILVTLILIYRKKLHLKVKPLLILAAICFVVAVLNFIAYSKSNAAFRVTGIAKLDFFEFIKQYLATFSLKFLFISGDPYKLNHPFPAGLLPWSFLPFLLLGLYKLNSLGRKALFVVVFLLLVPIPSALSALGQHSVRNSAMLFPFLILISIGIENVLKLKSGKLFFLGLSMLFLVETAVSFKYYYFDYSQKNSNLWGNAEKQAVQLAMKNKNYAENIIFTDNYNVMLSFWAFEKKVNPKEIQQAINVPELFLGAPSKYLAGAHFISLEQGANKDISLIITEKSLLIDTQNYLNDERFKVFLDKNLTFRYLEIE